MKHKLAKQKLQLLTDQTNAMGSESPVDLSINMKSIIYEILYSHELIEYLHCVVIKMK